MDTVKNETGSFHKIWLHVVISTHQHEPCITSKLEPFLYKHIQHLLKESGNALIAINGMLEHVHLLMIINPDKSISEAIRHIKKESAQTINLAKLIETTFAWHDGYAAYSVSESQVDKVREYINSQKEFHSKVTFREEFDRFLKAHKLETIHEQV